MSSSFDIDGVRWTFTERGTGPLVLLLHGTLSSAAMFDVLLDALADRYRCVAVDWPGHGKSGFNPAGWTADDLVDGVVQLIAALNASSASLIGLSQGGAVAMRVALRRPECIDSLVIMSAGPDGPPAADHEVLLELGRVLESGTDADRRAAAAAMQRKLHADGWVDAHPDLARAELEVILSHDRRAMPLVTQVPASYISVEELLPEIGCPTLVMWGEQDKRSFWSPSMAEAIPQARAVTVPGAGHHLTHDAPEVCVREVTSFLDGVHAGRCPH
jgi:pimeloyl-ACP methyl ester carboxylesterase